MSNHIGGLYIEHEYITFVKVDDESGEIVSMEVIPLDTSFESHEESIIDGLKQLKESESLEKKGKINFAYQSEQCVYFRTIIDSEIEDIYEQMSWELMVRVDAPIESFTIGTIPSLDNSSAFAVAQPIKTNKKYLSYLKKIGVKPKILSNVVISLANLLEQNYGANQETVLFYVSAPTSYVIYIKGGELWDTRSLYAIEEGVTPHEIVPKLMIALNDLKKRWDINDHLLTKMTGSLISDPSMKAEIVKLLPNCYEVNCFERIKNGTGIDLETVASYNSIISVAAGLALQGGN
jgi:hypothetical protein